jgi:hypothetical protein
MAASDDQLTSVMPTANLNKAFARPSHCQKLLIGLLGTKPAGCAARELQDAHAMQHVGMALGQWAIGCGWLCHQNEQAKGATEPSWMHLSLRLLAHVPTLAMTREFPTQHSKPHCAALFTNMKRVWYCCCCCCSIELCQ